MKKTLKMLKNLEKTIINKYRPGKYRQKSKRKIKTRQIYLKTVKIVEKPEKTLEKCRKIRKKTSKILRN